MFDHYFEIKKKKTEIKRTGRHVRMSFLFLNEKRFTRKFIYFYFLISYLGKKKTYFRLNLKKNIRLD